MAAFDAKGCKSKAFCRGFCSIARARLRFPGELRPITKHRTGAILVEKPHIGFLLRLLDLLWDVHTKYRDV